MDGLPELLGLPELDRLAVPTWLGVGVWLSSNTGKELVPVADGVRVSECVRSCDADRLCVCVLVKVTDGVGVWL